MDIKNHGGRCCGFKHIHGLPSGPTSKVPALEVKGAKHGASAEMHNEWAFFGDGAPLETGLERFNRFMDFLALKKGKGHIVEIVLNQYQNNLWKKILNDAGFKLVTTGYNCNTASTLYVYHLVLQLKPKKEKEKEDGISTLWKQHSW